MFEPISGQWFVKSPMVWVDFALSLIVLALMLLVALSTTRHKSYAIAASVISGTCLLSWFFGLTFLWSLTLVLMTGYVVVTLLQNQNDVRDLFNFSFLKK